MKAALRTRDRFGITALLALALLVAAAGGAHAAAQAICTGTSATVSISSVSWSNNVVSAYGTWSVTNAEAGYIEYYIDGTLYQSELKIGTSGSWTFGDSYSQCGSHTLTVYVYPAVYNGSGYTICWTHGTSTSAGFTVTCAPHASMSCTDIGYPVVECTGTASGGSGPYTGWWKVDNGNWYQDYPYTSSYGPWSQQYVCKWRQGVSFTVYFKVRDSAGLESNVVGRPCGLIF